MAIARGALRHVPDSPQPLQTVELVELTAPVQARTVNGHGGRAGTRTGAPANRLRAYAADAPPQLLPKRVCRVAAPSVAPRRGVVVGRLNVANAVQPQEPTVVLL